MPSAPRGIHELEVRPEGFLDLGRDQLAEVGSRSVVRIISEMRAHSPQSLPLSAAVVGAGAMGTGIALVLARAGIEVQLTARSAATLDRARARLAADPAGASIHTTTSLETALAGVGLVIETIVEEVEPKRAVLQPPSGWRRPARSSPRIPRRCRSRASPVRSKSAVASRAGTGSTLPLVRLVEIVRGEETSPPVVETLHDWERRTRQVSGDRATRSRRLRREPPAIRAAPRGLRPRRVWDVHEGGHRSRADRGPRPSVGGRRPVRDDGPCRPGRAPRGHAQSLPWSFSNWTDPPEALLQLTGEGKLGVKNGKGLRGTYDDERIQGLRALRDRLLAAIPGLREQRSGRREAAGCACSIASA